jgi:hypothetical protein
MVAIIFLAFLGGLGALIAFEVIDEFRASREKLTDHDHPEHP